MRSLCAGCAALWLAMCLGLPSVDAQQTSRFLAWNDGSLVAGGNGLYQGKFGGRVMFDVASFEQKDVLDDTYGLPNQGYEWRRLRVFHSGKIHSFRYKFQVEFSKEYAFIEDMYVEATKLPVVGNVRVGHMKEPFLFEMQSSSKHVLFMERALTTMFSSGRNLGIMLHNQVSGTDFYWAFGAFRNGLFDVVGKSHHFGYNVAGRFSGLLARNDDLSKFVHAGVGLKFSTFDDRTLSLSSRPESHLAHKYLSSGTIEAVRNMTSLSSELVLQSGRWSLQTEVVHSIVQPERSVSRSAYNFAAGTAQIGCFLTNDRRNYKNGNSGFGRIRPTNNLFAGGIGAIEAVMRYSRADLDSHDIHGQTLRNISLGFNWYPNSITRISVNKIYARIVNMGDARIYQMRFQLAI
ncbi:MAG: porin [Saprospiraceae bacterium]|nr:porin [Saprospiraceae bacterium]